MPGPDPDDDARLSWAPFGAYTDAEELPPLPELPPLGAPEPVAQAMPELSDRAEWRAAQLRVAADLPEPAVADDDPIPWPPPEASAPPPTPAPRPPGPVVTLPAPAADPCPPAWSPPDPATRTAGGDDAPARSSSSQGGAAVGFAIASFFTLGLILGGIALLLAIGTFQGRHRASQKLLAAVALVLVVLHVASWAVGAIDSSGPF